MASELVTIETNVHTVRVPPSSLWSVDDVWEISDECQRHRMETRYGAEGVEWVLVLAWRVHHGRLEVALKRAGFGVDVHNLWWIEAWRVWHTPIVANYMMHPDNVVMCRRLHGLLRDGTVTRNVKSYVVHYD